MIFMICIWISLLLVFTTCTTPTTSITQQNGLLILTDTNFQTALTQHPSLLINFYAPWCDHCKHLLPELQKLSTFDNLNTKLAKLDCTQNQHTSDKYEIESYPTLLYFVEDFYVEYRSFRTAEAISAWLEHQQNTVIVADTRERVQEVMGSRYVKVVYYGGRQGEGFGTWRKVSFYQDQQLFVLVEPKQLHQGYPQGSIVMKSKWHHQPLLYQSSPTDLLTLRQWVQDNSNPPVRPFTQKTVKLIFQQLNPALLLVNRNLNDSEPAFQALQHFGSFKDHEFICTQLTQKDQIFGKMIQWLAVNTTAGSFLVLIETKLRKVYLYGEEITGVTNEKLMEWVKDFQEGRLTPMHRPQDEQQQGQTQQQQQQQHSPQQSDDEL